ncbi:TRAP transporter large permease [Microbaculum sp. FT89]|uniref:TRAP transporter large permease n=1 Tax=Microbaculum sp. FT89 TaxID=3447298 RepID=UPI003F537935
MSGLESGLLAFGVLLMLLFAGVPVAFAMAVVAAAGIWLTIGTTFLLTTFTTTPYAVTADYTFVVVPMFVLMGGIAGRAGFISDLYTAAHMMLNRLKGSLLMATIVAQAGFAAASGSTVVASSVFTRMALPEMLRFGYKGGVAGGCIAAAGTLAGLIPPSIAMVLFAMLTTQPVGELLIAGLIPGVITALAYMIGLWVCLSIWPDWAPAATLKVTWRERGRALSRVWSIVLLMAAVMGGIYAGYYPPSAAGAVGAAGALTIAVVMRRIRPGQFWEALVEAARISAVIFAIVIAGLIFSRFLVISGFIGELRTVVIAMDVSPLGFMLVTILLFLVLGMFIDSVSLLVIAVPFLYPISQALDINPFWYAVLVVKLIEIAAITPPVGLNLFAVLAAADGRLKAIELFRGVVPFVIIESLVLALLITVPALSTWLPSKM